MLLFLDVVNAYSKVVLIVDMFGKIYSSFHFIELNFILESLDIPPGMEGKCVLVIFRIKNGWNCFFCLHICIFCFF